ncbi:MAG: hypothetical protein JWM11_4197 [Planctomycetaceae bacterium]|nr:hypothetical protein [Planctomycetaceae bacterium]
MRKAKVAEDRPENHSILRYLEDSNGTGLHPDVLDRLIELAAVSGCDRVSVRGIRLLVHRATGVIVGCGLGTDYCLRVAGVPKGAGGRWSIRWTDGGRLNVRNAFGSGWIVGGFHDGEAEWLRAAVAALEAFA